MRIGLIEITITAIVLGYIFKDKLFKKDTTNKTETDTIKDESDIIEGEIISDDADSK